MASPARSTTTSTADAEELTGADAARVGFFLSPDSNPPSMASGEGSVTTSDDLFGSAPDSSNELDTSPGLRRVAATTSLTLMQRRATFPNGILSVAPNTVPAPPATDTDTESETVLSSVTNLPANSQESLALPPDNLDNLPNGIHIAQNNSSFGSLDSGPQHTAPHTSPTIPHVPAGRRWAEQTWAFAHVPGHVVDAAAAAQEAPVTTPPMQHDQAQEDGTPIQEAEAEGAPATPQPEVRRGGGGPGEAITTPVRPLGRGRAATSPSTPTRVPVAPVLGRRSSTPRLRRVRGSDTLREIASSPIPALPPFFPPSPVNPQPPVVEAAVPAAEPPVPAPAAEEGAEEEEQGQGEVPWWAVQADLQEADGADGADEPDAGDGGMEELVADLFNIFEAEQARAVVARLQAGFNHFVDARGHVDDLDALVPRAGGAGARVAVEARTSLAFGEAEIRGGLRLALDAAAFERGAGAAASRNIDRAQDEVRRMATVVVGLQRREAVARELAETHAAALEAARAELADLQAQLAALRR